MYMYMYMDYFFHFVKHVHTCMYTIVELICPVKLQFTVYLFDFEGTCSCLYCYVVQYMYECIQLRHHLTSLYCSYYRHRYFIASAKFMGLLFVRGVWHHDVKVLHTCSSTCMHNIKGSITNKRHQLIDKCNCFHSKLFVVQ